jgi:hypothetical protein
MFIYWKTTSRLFACLLGLFILSIGPQVGLAEPHEFSKKKSLVGMSLGQFDGAPVPLGAAQETTHPKLGRPLNRIAKQAAKSPFAAVSMAQSMGLKKLHGRAIQSYREYLGRHPGLYQLLGL